MTEDLGHACAEGVKCTLPNIFCTYPNCYEGRRKNEHMVDAPAPKITADDIAWLRECLTHPNPMRDVERCERILAALDAMEAK